MTLDNTTAKLLELGLVFGGVMAWAGWQLWTLRRLKRERASRAAAAQAAQLDQATPGQPASRPTPETSGEDPPPN